jgi:hypothetical protein
MSGISLCLSTAGFARQQAQAVTLAHGKLMDLVVEKQWQQGNLSGDFSPDWPDYRWTAQVSNWDGETLEQLDVTVWWRHRGIERSGTVSTLVNTGLSYESTDETE